MLSHDGHAGTSIMTTAFAWHRVIASLCCATMTGSQQHLQQHLQAGCAEHILRRDGRETHGEPMLANDRAPLRVLES